jgi:glucoamylase
MKKPATQSGLVLPESIWSRADKDLVGTTLGTGRIWFTIGQGLLNEVFYPRIDIPQIRDLNFVVADGKNYWSDLRQENSYELEELEPGLPLIVCHHRNPKFNLSLRICPDLCRDVILVDYHYETKNPALELFFILTPRVGNTNLNQHGTTFIRGLLRAIAAEQGPFGLALMGSFHGDDVLSRLQVGLLGQTDAWTDLNQNNTLTHENPEAGPGVLTLAGALKNEGTLAIGFSSSASAAATLAASALVEPFEKSWHGARESWKGWQSSFRIEETTPLEFRPMMARSILVLKSHQDRAFPGAMVASLSVPWGESLTTLEGHSTGAGYHLVWPRDLVESAMSFFILGQPAEALRVLSYLIATQQPDGHWFQNQWLGGRPYWEGIQLDEAAFPVLLAGFLREAGALGSVQVTEMVRRALTFIVHSGPATDQDRWEEDSGINPFTLAVLISALVEGSVHLKRNEADFVLSIADEWNASLEEWCYVTNTDLARQHEVDGYYVRIAPREVLGNRSALNRSLLIHNRSDGASPPASEQIAMDFLQLVRYGLRSPMDPHILSTLKVADALLAVETPSGPVWHRYNGDGYGEHQDGHSFNGTGIGRGWPLLVGERGHYALAAGQDPLPYLHGMTKMTGPGGLIPEQVWDQADLRDAGLRGGKPTRSAMPLLWAHAEFIKLCASRSAGRILDLPATVWKRYQGKKPKRSYVGWSYNCQRKQIPAGLPLRILLSAPGLIHYGHDGWQEPKDLSAEYGGLGLYYADLPTAHLAPGQSIQFTFRWLNGRWEGQDFSLVVADSGDTGSI